MYEMSREFRLWWPQPTVLPPQEGSQEEWDRARKVVLRASALPVPDYRRAGRCLIRFINTAAVFVKRNRPPF